MGEGELIATEGGSSVRGKARGGGGIILCCLTPCLTASPILLKEPGGSADRLSEHRNAQL